MKLNTTNTVCAWVRHLAVFYAGSNMNWIKKIFGLKTERQCAVHGVRDMCALPEEILTPEQIQNALTWYNEHRNHVNSLVNGVSKFPPRLNEDKRDCRLWKPEHWNWFLSHYH